jgi:outer membrane protein TolC
MIRARRAGAALVAVLVAVAAGASAPAAEAPYSIDLRTVLRLARADNLDVRLAEERVAEARAAHATAIGKFLPWVAAGIAWRRHEGATQAVDGSVIDVDKDSTSVGPTITAQIELGDALFGTLVARQVIAASQAALTARREDSVLASVSAYFDLLKAQGLESAQRDALGTSRAYEQQLEAGLEAGVIFRGDLLRVQTQTQRYQAALLQAGQQRRVAAARLAELLHLDPAVDLLPDQSEFVPLTLAGAADQEAELEQALGSRAELEQSSALLAAARSNRSNAVWGPLIPSVGAQAFFGNLTGGPDGVSSASGSSRDYMLGLQWRFGPGGLFDLGRIRAADSKLRSAQIELDKVSQGIRRQVIEARARLEASDDALAAGRASVEAATEALRLTRERKQLGVGLVLEDLQAQQELVRARSDYVTALAEHNKAQYELQKAVGGL